MEAALEHPAASPLPPTLPTWRPLGHLLRFRTEPLAMFAEAMALGDLVRLRCGPRYIVIASHPDHAEHVLVRHPDRYAKQTRGYDMLRLVLGAGLLTSEGARWKRQRRIVNPAFHQRCLTSFATVMGRAADAQVARWRPLAGSGRVVDVSDAMSALTLAIAGETLFGTGFEERTAAIGDALGVILPHINRLVTTPFPAPDRLPTAGNRSFRHAIATLDRVVAELLSARRDDPSERHDLLEMLLAARDEHGEPMSDRQLRDEILTLVLAGHETTANSLTWTLMLLSEHPESEARLRDEAREVLDGRVPRIEDVARLPYTRAVLQESMRLFPPVWAIGRKALEDDVIGGYAVPAGTFVYISPWNLHRHRAAWDDPERFDPDRFAPGQVAARHRLAYLPFSAGSRKCIGDRFAELEATIVLAHLAQHVRLRSVPGEKVTPQADVTLSPRGGLRMTIEPA